MERLKSYIIVVVGSLLVGIGLSLFFIGSQIIPTSIFGLTKILELKFNINSILLLLLFNSLAFLIGAVFLPEKKYSKFLISGIIIPISIFVFKNIRTIIDLSEANTFLHTVFGAGIVGYGFKLIYKEDGDASGIDILEQVIFKGALHSKKIITYCIDILIIFSSYISFGLESTMYTTITIIIIEYISKLGMLNSSNTKVFYIITKNEEEVKKYIMEELKCGLTIFDVVGGYTKTKNKVLMSAIPTKEYYKLREGVKKIDSEAFITITDTYEVINAELNK